MQTALTSGGNIAVTFPGTFDISGAQISSSGVKGFTGTAGTVSITSRSDHAVVITRGGGASASGSNDVLTVTLTGIRNPEVTGPSGDIQITTRDDIDKVLDTGKVTGFTVDAGKIND